MFVATFLAYRRMTVTSTHVLFTFVSVLFVVTVVTCIVCIPQFSVRVVLRPLFILCRTRFVCAWPSFS